MMVVASDGSFTTITCHLFKELSISNKEPFRLALKFLSFIVQTSVTTKLIYGLRIPRHFMVLFKTFGIIDALKVLLFCRRNNTRCLLKLENVILYTPRNREIAICKAKVLLLSRRKQNNKKKRKHLQFFFLKHKPAIQLVSVSSPLFLGNFLTVVDPRSLIL